MSDHIHHPALEVKSDMPSTMPSGFSAKPIYRVYSLFLLALIVITVLPHYGKIINPETEVTAQFIAHSALYLAWYLLFAVQCHLSSVGNVALHRRLGYSSFLLFALLAYSGGAMLLDLMQSYDSQWSPAYLASKKNLVWGTLHTVVFFVGFYLLGIALRKRLQIHKRLMLLASLSMISASVTRVAFLPLVPINGTLLTLLSTYMLLLVPVVIDRIHFQQVHPVFKWGVPLYIVTQMIFVGVLPGTEMGMVIAFPFD